MATRFNGSLGPSPGRRGLILASPLLLAAPWLLAGCMAVPPPGALTGEDLAVLARVQATLQSIRTLRARFVQVAEEGSSVGTAWIERPGRLRLQYDPPSQVLLVAARGRVVFANGATGASSSLPLARTPLSILLAQDIVLSGPVTVVSVRRGMQGSAEVTLRSTQRPGQGQISLEFSGPELMLRGLVLVDGHGDTTHLALSDLQVGVAVDETLFQLPGA